MFEERRAAEAGHPCVAQLGSATASAGPAPADLDAAGVRAWIDALGGMDHRHPDAELVEQLRALEDLKAAAAAAQARAAVALHASVVAAQAAAGLPTGERGRGVAAQVALARRDAPHAGGRHLGLARALVGEMPHTLAALSAGWLSEWRATLLVRETACLSAADRGVVDAALCADPATLARAGNREVTAKARALAARLDPHALTDRARRAATERRVSLRPAPDTMSQLSSLLPVADGVAALAALTRAADAARAAGDPRSRGQIMADTLVERLTGHPASHAPVPADPARAEPAEPDQSAEPDQPAGAADVMVHLVMTDRALLEGDHEPAVIPGYGPIPAPLARDLIRGRPGPGTGPPGADPPGAAARQARVFLRRIFTHPATGELVAMESRARAFPPALRRLLVARDQTCRTPWCDAPIRHGDHARPHAAGGATDAANGQGLCEACNYAKETPGFSARPAPASRPGRHELHLTTPTGHGYATRPPAQPGWTGRAVADAHAAAVRARAPRPVPHTGAFEVIFTDFLHRTAA